MYNTNQNSYTGHNNNNNNNDNNNIKHGNTKNTHLNPAQATNSSYSHSQNTTNSNSNSTSQNNNSNQGSLIKWRYLNDKLETQDCKSKLNGPLNKLAIGKKVIYIIGNVKYSFRKIDQYTIKEKNLKTKKSRILKSTVCICLINR